MQPLSLTLIEARAVLKAKARQHGFSSWQNIMPLEMSFLLCSFCPVSHPVEDWVELLTEPDSRETESKNEKGKKQGGDLPCHTTVTVGDYCHQAEFHHFPVMSGMHHESQKHPSPPAVAHTWLFYGESCLHGSLPVHSTGSRASI